MSAGVQRQEDDATFFDVLGRLLTVAALSLPVLGAIARWAAFRVDESIVSPTTLVLAASTLELLVDGIVPALLTVGLLASLLFLTDFAPALHKADLAVRAYEKVGADSRSVKAGLDAVRARTRELELKMKTASPDVEASPELVAEFQELEAFADRVVAEAGARAEEFGEAASEVKALVIEAERAWEKAKTNARPLSRLVGITPSRAWQKGLIVGAGALLLLAFPPVLLMASVISILIAVRFWRIARRTGMLSLRRISGPLALALFVAAMAWGLEGRLAGLAAANYVFNSKSQRDGWYSNLGSDDGLLLLRSCDANVIIAVSEAQVRTVRYPAKRYEREASSLWSALTRRELPEVGADYACPD